MNSAQSLTGKRGSVLIVTLILCAVIGISLVSYYRLSASALKGSTRSFYSLSNIDLAEIGVERAMACFYVQSTGVASATAWAGWTLSGNTAKRTFAGFVPGPNANGVVRVYVNYYTNSGGTPVIVAKATITPPDGPPIDKVIEITAKSRGLWTNGIVAKESITGDSNLKVDSWNSATTSPATLYSTGVRKANGPIGVVAAVNGALSLGDNPTIYGSVKTGGGTVSKTGSAKLTGTVGGTGWNPALEAHDFSYTFPAITVPTPSTVNPIAATITANVTFPRVGDVAASDGKYYYNFGLSTINYASKTMTISGACVFLMTSHASGTNSVSTSSSATWAYGNDTATLEVYTSGSFDFDSGASWFMNGAPSRCKIFMTAASGSQFHTRGGGSWNGCIYAPNTAFNIDSGGSFGGSVVMKTCQLRGGVNFHYDEALGLLASGTGLAVMKWKELQSAAERATYAAVLSF